MKYLILFFLLCLPVIAADAPPITDPDAVAAKALGDKIVARMLAAEAAVKALTTERDQLKAQLAAEKLRADAEKAKAVQAARASLLAEILAGFPQS